MIHRVLIACLFALTAGGCSSLPTTLAQIRPDQVALQEAPMRELAAQVERAVHEGVRDFEIVGPAGASIETPEIRQSIRTRAARAQLVSQFLDTGFAFENNRGLIEIIRSSEYKRAGTSRDRDRDALMVMGENNDRWALYEGLVKANNIQPKYLGEIQRIFYEARIELLQPGQKYQTSAGDVVAK